MGRHDVLDPEHIIEAAPRAAQQSWFRTGTGRTGSEPGHVNLDERVRHEQKCRGGAHGGTETVCGEREGEAKVAREQRLREGSARTYGVSPAGQGHRPESENVPLRVGIVEV